MKTPSVVWLQNGRILKQVEDSVQIIDTLPKRIYTMNFNPNKNEIFLEDFADKFNFDFKIYGMESKLISHIMRTFESTANNLGIMFNGIKGTGKTITAKIIANETNLPVILINAPYPGLADFISKINCPCVLFFDEFEKNFKTEKGQDLELLSIMDGVFNSPYRRVFLLTTNKPSINENFIGRPSRIRYKKSFGNLQPEVVKEYLDDCLEDKTKAPEILEFIDSLSISTIDILKCIVEEVNIHKCSINDIRHLINVEQARYKYSIKAHYTEIGTKNPVGAFKEALKKVGTEDSDGDVLNEDDLGIYSRQLNTSTSLEFFKVGDTIGSLGTVIQSLNDEGYMVVENDSWQICAKVLNLNNRPSLYRGGLAY